VALRQLGENLGSCRAMGCGLSAWRNGEDPQGKAAPLWVTCPPAPWSGGQEKLEERITFSVLVAVTFIPDDIVKRGNLLNTVQKLFPEKKIPALPHLSWQTKTKMCAESMEPGQRRAGIKTAERKEEEERSWIVKKSKAELEAAGRKETGEVRESNRESMRLGSGYVEATPRFLTLGKSPDLLLFPILSV